MSGNKSRVFPEKTPRASALVIQCEVLRGAFADAQGHLHHGKVDLPGGQFASANNADPAPVLLTAEDGAVLDVLGSEFPALAILRVPTSPLHPVTATVIPEPRYDALEIKSCGMLRSVLRRAVRHSDASLLGQVATASARMHQRRLPKPRFDVLLNVADSFGACGFSVSHGGSGVAFIFNPEKCDFYWSMQGAARALRELGIWRASHLPRPGTAWRSGSV